MLLSSRSIPRSPRTKQAVCLARCLVRGKVIIIQQHTWASSPQSPTASARSSCVKFMCAPTPSPRIPTRNHAAAHRHNHTLRRPRPLGQCIRSTAFIPAALKSCPRSRASTSAPTTLRFIFGCIRSANTDALKVSIAANRCPYSRDTGKTDLRSGGGQVRELRTLQTRERVGAKVLKIDLAARISRRGCPHSLQALGSSLVWYGNSMFGGQLAMARRPCEFHISRTTWSH